MLQMRLVQQKDNKKCWTTCWTNFFSLSFLDHRLSAPKILFPWSPIHWRKVHEAMVCRYPSLCFGSFMNQMRKALSEWANPNTLVCLYLCINCFVRSNLRMYVLMSEPSSYADGLYHGNKVAAKLQVHVLFVGFDHGLKYRRSDDRYRKVTLEDVSHGCHSLPTSHPRYVEPTTPETGVSWCIRPAFHSTRKVW